MLSVILAAAVVLVAPQPAARAQRPRSRIDLRTQRNRFEVGRIATLRWYPPEQHGALTFGGWDGTYEARFGDRFMADVEALTPKSTWIDLGAGCANAQLGALTLGKKTFRALAVGYKHPNADQRIADELAHPSFRYQEGDFYGHSIEQLGGAASADMVTGVVALGFYNTEWDKLITKVGTLLKPGGRYYETTRDGYGWRKDGKVVDQATFFRNIRGLRMIEDRRNAFLNETVMVFERTNEPLVVPELDHEEGPPSLWTVKSKVKPYQIQGYIPSENRDAFYIEP